MVLGITYNFLPFMVLPLYASLERIDPRLLEAGYDLYGRRRDVFLRVTLPLSIPGVVAGTLLTFIPAAGDFINAELLGTPGSSMIGNVIQSRFLEVADYPTAAALSFTLMARDARGRGGLARIAGTEALLGTEAEERRADGGDDRRQRHHRQRGPRAAQPPAAAASCSTPGSTSTPALALLYLLVPIASSSSSRSTSRRGASTSSGRSSRSTPGRTRSGCPAW